VTSAAVSERLGPIGLAIVSYEAADGARLTAVTDGTRLTGENAAAIVAPLPFA